MTLLARTFADRLPFRVFEVPNDGAAAGETPPVCAIQPEPAPSRGRRASDAIAS
jgi:hypothetical protein